MVFNFTMVAIDIPNRKGVTQEADEIHVGD